MNKGKYILLAVGIGFVIGFAAKQTVAVLPSEGILKDEELVFFTDKAQEIAVQALPKSSFEVFPQNAIIKRLGGVDNYIKECKENSCVVELGRKAMVDYVAQCSFGKLGSDLTVSFELYNVSTEGLIDKFVDKAKNTDGLLVIMEKKISDGFMKIPGAAPVGSNSKDSLSLLDLLFEKDSADQDALSEAQKSLKNKTTPPPATNGISGGMFTDSRNGKKYKTVKIGTQTWMAKNLNYAADGSKCYGNNSENCKKYGRLYDWNVAMRVCPSGWHLPSDAEWDELMAAVNGTETAGKKLKAKSGWNYKRKSGNGTDEFGFSALPGGYGGLFGGFSGVGHGGNWWSANEYSSRRAYRRSMYYYDGYAYWDSNYKSYLFSVRCVQD